MKKLLLITVLVSAISFAQKPIFASAKVKAATVYFNAAELQQTTSVNLPVGTSEIVIKNVADYLNENTVQIGAPNSVTVCRCSSPKITSPNMKLTKAIQLLKKCAIALLL